MVDSSGESDEMSEEKNYDHLFGTIYNGEGNITGFLDAVFDFLYRRTDFFQIEKSDGSSDLGLPLGAAESFVKTSFLKYYEMSIVENNIPSSDEPVSFDVVNEEVVMTDPIVAENTEVISDDVDSKPKESKEKVYQSYCESYNGASYESYSWSQTLKDIDVQVKVPVEVVSGRQVKVDFSQHHLSVKTFENSEWRPIVNEDLMYKVNVEESAWTLVPREHVHLCLHKVQNRWWEACFVNEPKIDVHSIDASQPYEELDEESQAKIRELMYNEHLKRLGKPTIEQVKMADVLRDAWNLDNSPFKGQPFDPSVLEVASGDVPKLPTK